MRPHALASVTSLTLLILPGPLLAQEAGDVVALRAEIARLRAELATLEKRLDKVESAEGQPAAAEPPAPAAQTVAAAQPEMRPAQSQKPGTNGLSIKPRGRLQLDTGRVSRPSGITAQTLGWSSDVRRAYLGVDGTLGGGFGYRLEFDFAGSSAQVTDGWLTYRTGPVTFTVGHHKPFASLDEQTSDLETSLLERAAFTQAFGFERRLGASLGYAKGDIMLNAGIFADDLETLGSGVTDNSYSLDSRLVFMPRVGGTQLHVAGSLHHRELNGLTQTLRYRTRPGSRLTDVRFVDTGQFSARAETGYGLELAAIHGPVHFAAEGFWQRVARPGLADPTFFGGYAEIGYVFAGGNGRSYRNGAFGSIKPVKGLDKGGTGAWQVNLRHDWLDLSSSGINGGTQRTLAASLVWMPVEHVKFLANYLRINVEDTPILAGSDDDYSVDVLGLRAQYDF